MIRRVDHNDRPPSGGPWQDSYGNDLFDAVMDDFDRWLREWPRIEAHEDGEVKGRHARDLHADVWPSLTRLMAQMQARGVGDLARSIEAAFQEVLAYAHEVDAYCESDRFDARAWHYGDEEAKGQQEFPDADALVAEDILIDEAREIGEQPLLSRDEAGGDTGRISRDKCEHHRVPVGRVAQRRKACFWLACQMERRSMDHARARQLLDEYLSSTGCPSEIKAPLMDEALERAYGQWVHGLPVFDDGTTASPIGRLWEVLKEARAALSRVSADAVETARKQAKGDAGKPPAPDLAGESFAPGTAASVPPQGKALLYEFKVVGEVWHVRFGDEYGEIVDRVGMARIFSLLLQPNPAEAITALRLCGVDESGIEERHASRQEVLDVQARRQCRDKLAELNADIEEANNSGNLAEAERLTGEREVILKELRKDRMSRRKGKELGPREAKEKAAEAVARSLKTVYSTLRQKKLPKAADHLNRSIKTESYAFAYRPGPNPPAWHF